MADDTYMGEDEDQVGDDARPTEPSLPQQPEDQYEKLMRWADPSTINIADDIDDSTLASIGHRVKHEYDIDVTSRADWMEKTKQATMEGPIARPSSPSVRLTALEVAIMTSTQKMILPHPMSKRLDLINGT